jgi:hypothetical protein
VPGCAGEASRASAGAAAAAAPSPLAAAAAGASCRPNQTVVAVSAREGGLRLQLGSQQIQGLELALQRSKSKCSVLHAHDHAFRATCMQHDMHVTCA